MAADELEVRKPYFTRVKAAREALQEKSRLAVTMYFKTIRSAIKAGDHEAAAKALQWYMEHAPATEDGLTIIDPSVDKVKVTENSGPTGPIINFGIKIGGVDQPKALPEAPKVEIIDVTPTPKKDVH